MHESYLEKWTEALTELREVRREKVKSLFLAAGNSIKPEEFYPIAEESIAAILDKWMEMEQKSFENMTTGSLTNTLNTLHTEMESVIEFELEAINRDMEEYQDQLMWDESAAAGDKAKFHAAVEEIRKRCQVKINALRDAGRKRPAEAAASAPRAASGGGSPASNSGTLLMFIVGLVLGLGPSIYFWDAAKKSEKKTEEERAKIRAEQKQIEDGLAVLQENFEGLATGKKKNIPQIDKDISAVRAKFQDEREDVESDFRRDKEKLLKRIPAGAKQDEGLQKLMEKKEEELEKLKGKEKTAIEPLLEEKEILKALVAR